MNAVMLIISITLGVAASGCALTAAYVYLRVHPNRDGIARENLARRWLAATAVLGFAVIVVRFIWVFLG